MKNFHSKSLFLSLTSLGLCLLGGVTPVLGNPAPLVQPLVGDIKSQLPEGKVLRLPAYLPDSPVQLYPYLKTDSMGFGVYVSYQPDCQLPSCTLGALGILLGDSPWPPKGNNRTPIRLTQTIEGFYLSRGKKGSDKTHYVFWQQDDQFYVVGILDLAATSEDVIAIAKSMATEKPIKL